MANRLPGLCSFCPTRLSCCTVAAHVSSLTCPATRLVMSCLQNRPLTLSRASTPPRQHLRRPRHRTRRRALESQERHRRTSTPALYVQGLVVLVCGKPTQNAVRNCRSCTTHFLAVQSRRHHHTLRQLLHHHHLGRLLTWREAHRPRSISSAEAGCE